MEVLPQSVSPHIQRVLKTFQTTADRTLQGPGHGGLVMLPTAHEMAKLTAEDYRKAFSVKSKAAVEQLYRGGPPFPVQQLPVFTPVDTSCSEKTETDLENEKISCFIVGGEKRLCLPQILNTALREYTLQQINTVCDDLHIFCSRCQPEQLEILKLSGILPPSAPSCGLITKTDAERLCNALIHTSTDSAPSHPSPNSFKVYHECFGKSKGVFNPEAYTSASALCVQCVDCGRWFTTQKFVCHSHKALENRTCHWGFDSANWRHYLLLAKHQPGIEKLQEILEQIKSRFDNTNKYKRKQVSDSFDTELVKRSKSEENGSPSSSPWMDAEHSSTLRAMMSAFQPWSTRLSSAMKEGKFLPAPPAIMREGFAVTAPSYLHSGPPVLLHPDKVVPHSESSRYEPNYAPNVSLAPFQKCKGEDDDEEEEDDVGTQTDIKKPAEPVTPEAGSSKSFKEWELSESDDSSVERSSPPQGDDCRLSPSSEDQRALEIEIEMIRQALDGKIGEDKEEKDRFIREFCKLRAKHVEILNRNIQARRSLKQELASTKATTKEKLQESADRTMVMEKELSKLRRESESRLQEVQGDKEKLIKDVKALQEREDLEIGKLLQVNQELQTGLQHYKMAFEQIRVENIIMQEKLLTMGVNIIDLMKANCNGNMKLMKSPSRSPPQRSPTDTMSPLHGHGAGGYGVMPPGVISSHAAIEMYLKKEREGGT